MAMKKQKFYFTIILDFVAVALVLIVPFILRAMLHGAPNCWSLQMGIICPACGGTRCLLNLLEGNLVTAITLNPMVLFVVLYLCVVLLCLNFFAFTKLKLFQKALRLLTNYKLIIALTVCFVVVGTLRNFLFRDYFLSILLSV